MKRLLQLPFAVAIALAGADASALGLGPVHVNSGLNQPLNAEIPVIAGSAAEADGLVAQLASDQEFERVGLSRSRIGVPLTFNVVKGPRGDLVIKVTSQEPVRQTFIDFLVEANWPKGRVLREYTLLLDPPITAPVSQAASTGGPGSVTMIRPEAKPTMAPAARPTPPPVAVSTPPPVPARTAAPPPQPVAERTPPPPPPPRPVAAPAPIPEPPPATAAKPDHYGPVEAGDNLISIARAQPLESVNLDQMMLALLKRNPDAFYKPNINALKRGAILRIPSAADARAAGSASAAAAEVRSQIEDWRGARATPTVIADAGDNAPAVSAAAESNAKAATATPSPRGKERLELVPPRSGDAGTASADRPGSGPDSGTAKGIRAELSPTREALASAQQESAELKSRVGELETLKEKNDRLLSLKDSEIADLQGKLKALQQAGGAAPSATGATAVAKPQAPALAAGAPGAKSDSAPAAAPSLTDPVAEKSPGSSNDAKTASTSAAAAGPAPSPVTGATAPAASSTTTAPPPAAQPAGPATPPTTAPKPATATPKTGTAPTRAAPSSAIDEMMQQDWFMPAALAAGALLLLLIVLGLRRRAAAPKSRSSLADAFAESSPSSADTAHASSSSVVEDLRRQLADHPGNAGLYLELLSVHYAERDIAGFEADAADMHAHVADENGPEWREAQAMGRELAPANPLFQSTAHPARVATAATLAAGAAALGMRHDDDALPHDDTIARSAHPFGFDRASEGEATPPDAAAVDRDGTHSGAADRFDRDADQAFDQPPRGDAVDDLSLGFPTATEAARSERANSDAHANPFGLDLDAPHDSLAPPQDITVPGMPVESRDEHLLDFGHAPLPFDGISNERAEFTDAPLTDDLAATHADTPRTPYDFPGGDDAIATKLDLAKAYMDMGDPDGARAMLGEVVAEGSPAQKNEAERLLAELR